MCSNKEYLVCSGKWNNNLFVDFQLSIVKNCDFFTQTFQHKNERPILPLCSGISYNPIDHSSSAAQHWTCLIDFVIGGCTFSSFCQNMGLFCLPDKIIILHKMFSCVLHKMAQLCGKNELIMICYFLTLINRHTVDNS